jgi:hypothetical protein
MNAPATFPSPQYLRLFGNLSPDQVMTVPSLPASCDPSQAAEGLFCEWLAERGHPSAHALAQIAALRLRHLANGHTPETDCAHGPTHFWRGAQAFYSKAVCARSPEKRRKNLIAAAAMIVAQIDAEAHAQGKEMPDA